MLNIGLGFLLGILIGSLVDCLANRSLSNSSFWGRSYCDKCMKTLVWYDLFPVLSYFLNSGRSRCCKTKLSPEYLLVELLMGVLTAAAFYLFDPLKLGFNLSDTLFKVFVIGVLVSVFITDIKKGLIPDRITYPALGIAFVYLLSSTIVKIYLIYQSFQLSPLGKYLLPPHSDYFYRHALLTAEPLLFGVGSAFALGLFFLSLIIITKGRGMGGGDFKLAIFLGLILGFPDSLLMLLLSFLLGSLVGVGLIIFGLKKFGQTIPFGPFLSLASLIALFWGRQIIDWYLKLRVPY